MLVQLAQGDQGLAEEWCQDALARAWQKLSTWNGQSRFGTWLYRLARNRAIDLLRAKRGQSLTEVHEDGAGTLNHRADDQQSPAQQLEQQERITRVQQAMNQLPDDLRELIVMKDFSQLSYEEIGAALDIPEGTAKSRVFRARQALRKQLLPMMEAESS